MKLVIEGDPIAKNRPRFKRVGSFVQTYDSQSKEKAQIKRKMLKELSNYSFSRRFQGALSLTLNFFTKIPKSISKKKQKELIDAPNAKRPDLDNYVKMYLDVMNKLIYEDDGQIFELRCKKLFSENPRVEIVVSCIENTENV